MRQRSIVAGVLAMAVALVACTEKPQTTSRKDDSKAFQSASGAYVADGWKVGDEASWEQQMRNRAQGQNEYSRTGVQ